MRPLDAARCSVAWALAALVITPLVLVSRVTRAVANVVLDFADAIHP